MSQPVLIIGAGLAGLSCAVHLHRAGIPVRIFEAADDVGGRVRTDLVDGFLLDRGFQVYLDAYPESGNLLSLDALDLQAFEPGALVYDGKRMHRVMDVFRRPRYAISSALAPIGSVIDKLRVALLRCKISGTQNDQIQSSADSSTESYLRAFGFSQRMIDTFFRSFYGGIFLENDLRTSSRMFEFTFKMFSQGSATLPRKGMGQISQQLAGMIPLESIQLNSPVKNMTPKSITLESGDLINGQRVIIATDASALHRLLPKFSKAPTRWKSVTNIYYSASKSPLNEAIIALNGSTSGLVNNVCVLSDISSDYAPEDKALISVSLLGLPDEEHLSEKILTELTSWFGEEVKNWQHLRTDRIEKALPEQEPGTISSPGFQTHNDYIICGDHCLSSSIEGAIVSGKKAAQHVLQES